MMGTCAANARPAISSSNGITDQRTSESHDAVNIPVYFCPLCGQSAAPDQWWTPEQADYAKRAIAGPMMEELEHELKRGLRQLPGSILRFDAKGEAVEPPPALREVNDMVIVEAPCHPWEPVKVPTDAGPPLHCLICGQAFVA
jgi:hypothetical protein